MGGGGIPATNTAVYVAPVGGGGGGIEEVEAGLDIYVLNPEGPAVTVGVPMNAFDAYGAAAAAQAAAEAASDPSGSAATAQSNAEAYAATQASNAQAAAEAASDPVGSAAAAKAASLPALGVVTGTTGTTALTGAGNFVTCQSMNLPVGTWAIWVGANCEDTTGSASRLVSCTCVAGTGVGTVTNNTTLAIGEMETNAITTGTNNTYCFIGTIVVTTAGTFLWQCSGAATVSISNANFIAMRIA